MDEQKLENETVETQTEQVEEVQEQQEEQQQVLDPDAQAAADALASIESQAPVSAVAEQREKKQDAQAMLELERQKRMEVEVEKARLQGRLEAIQKPEEQQQEPVKSPLQLFKEENDASAFVPVEVYEAESKFQAEQKQIESENQQVQQLANDVNASLEQAKTSMSDEKLGVGLGLESVVALAKQNGLISNNDNNYAASHGKNAASTLYQIAVSKIKMAGGAAAQELTRRIQLKKATVSNKQNVIQPKTEQDENKEEFLSQQTAEISRFILG